MIERQWQPNWQMLIHWHHLSLLKNGPLQKRAILDANLWNHELIPLWMRQVKSCGYLWRCLGKDQSTGAEESMARGCLTEVLSFYACLRVQACVDGLVEGAVRSPPCPDWEAYASLSEALSWAPTLGWTSSVLTHGGAHSPAEHPVGQTEKIIIKT